MQQNSHDWSQWRHAGLGASDAPIVLNKSKYSTPYQLWLEKTLPYEPRTEGNTFVQDLGHNFEPKILTRFCLENDVDAGPELFEHREFSWLKASLDGWVEKTRNPIEIKYVGKDRLAWVRENQKVLPDHEDQIQHQFMVTGAFTGYYICYTLTSDRKQIDEVVTIKTEADNAYITETLFPALKTFWDMVQSGKAPKLTAGDEKVLTDEHLVNHAQTYSSLLLKKKELEKQMEIHEKVLKEEALKQAAGKIKVGSLNMTVSVRKGNVDYSKIPQLENVDLELYRKSATRFVSIRA